MNKFHVFTDSQQRNNRGTTSANANANNNTTSSWSHTHGFVLLRQKNALPSGMGRTFSLGGARSAIFNWTPPSDRRRGGEKKDSRRRGGEKRDKN